METIMLGNVRKQLLNRMEEEFDLKGFETLDLNVLKSGGNVNENNYIEH